MNNQDTLGRTGRYTFRACRRKGRTKSEATDCGVASRGAGDGAEAIDCGTTAEDCKKITAFNRHAIQDEQ